MKIVYVFGYYITETFTMPYFLKWKYGSTKYVQNVKENDWIKHVMITRLQKNKSVHHIWWMSPKYTHHVWVWS